MVCSSLLRLILRTAIVVSLVVGGLTPSVMATPRVSDCMVMMQGGATTDDAGGDMDARAPCPFAAYCAVASAFVAPPVGLTVAIAYEPVQVLGGYDDLTRPEHAPSPPSRPPRS